MNLGKGFGALAQGSEKFKLLQYVLAALQLLFSCFTVSIVPFTRKDHGERFLGWLNLFFGYTIVAFFTSFGNVIGVASGHRFSWMMVLFWLAFIAASLYHRFEIHRKNKAGVEWHSRYMGTSLLPLPAPQETIYKFFEPAIVFVSGLLIWKLSLQVGIWLMTGGVALLFNNHIIFYNERQAFLDIRDAQIEAKYGAMALAGRPASETGGFVIAASNIELVRKDEGLQRVFASLSPDMQQLFDAQPDFRGTAA